MSSIEAGHGLRSVHMTLERDFDIERMEFDSVLDYLLPTILLLMLRIRFLRAALERQALDWPSALILLFLLVDGHAIAIGELAQALDLSTSTVSTTARKLEARGFTFYSEVPGDRRIVQVSLTTAGTGAAERALDCLAQEFREQFSLDPGLDPEEGFSESAYGQHSYAIMAGGPCTADVLWLLSHFQASLVMLQRHIGTIKGRSPHPVIGEVADIILRRFLFQGSKWLCYPRQQRNGKGGERKRPAAVAVIPLS